MSDSSSYTFRAEIKQLLNILIHSLYQDRDIFLRELISNASDALTRLHFETLTNATVLDPEAELAIHLDVEEKGEEDDQEKWLVIKDSGIGMTEEELVQNLGTIAQSGAREFLSSTEREEVDLADIIGQFGVGFYSVFMVADEVRVVSRSARPEATAAVWISTGGDSFTVEPADKADRGTEIHIKLKKDADEFGQTWKLRQIIKKHSDFVSYPIYIGEDQANQQTPLWRKQSSGIEEGDYKSFYQQLTMDFEEPISTIHFSSDSPVNVRALLFIPAKAEKNMLAARPEPGVKLYSHSVLIQEYCTDLLPKWLEFVDGVVDSEDLPLNVSRETVQNNRLMRQLGKTITKRVLRELRKLAKNDSGKYAEFYGEFGRALKEGVATDPAGKDDILPFLRYQSTTSGDDLRSLDAYIESMGEEQDEIYYVLADNVEMARHSPHLDPFKARGIEVLYWADPLDAFLVSHIGDYKEKKLRNIDSADIDLPDTDDEEADGDEEQPIEEKAFNTLVGRFVTTLGERVTEVRASKVLKDSPVRLVSPEDAPNQEMERIYRFVNKDYEVPKKIMEVNRGHALIADLATMIEDNADAPLINLTIEQLFESALVQEGLHPNPAGMLPRIQQILEIAAKK